MQAVTETGQEPEQSAEQAGLVYVSDAEPGITRRRQGSGFGYRLPGGRRVTDRRTLARIRSLAIPPAWTEVWICPVDNGHLQATGRDARGRKQFRYHPAWREVRDQDKYDRMLSFAHMLPAIRAKVDEHMRLSGLPREKVLATVISLLERTLIRIGNSEYAKTNRSYGLTTLCDRHVAIEGAELRFRFQGKGGKTWRLGLADRRIARIARSCQDLPGQQLFQYIDEAGEIRGITSSDVNDYLREISGADITAKDFRTWAGTVLAAMALKEFESFDSKVAGKRNIRAAIEKVAARLGNTATICRKCYVHPEIVNCYLDGDLAEVVKGEVEREIRDELSGLDPEEAVVLALLQRRLSEAAAGDRSPAASAAAG